MIKYLLLFLLPFSHLLLASKILSYNIYDRTDRADVMITFDTPYDGVIKQSISKSKIVIKLSNASIESSKIKNVSSKFLHSITITPMAGQTQIVASVPSSVRLIASKTSDAYGLRLRFTTNALSKKISSKVPQKESSGSLSTLPTKKSDNMSTSYYIVVAILVIGILILFMLKKRMASKNIQNQPNQWLFQASDENKTETPAATPPPSTPTQTENNNISIRFQKTLNEKNSVVMLDFGEQSYLVLMGNNNILLDKFSDNKPATESDFESILQSRHQELDDFLRVEANRENNNTNQPKEALQAYKERAASILYEA